MVAVRVGDQHCVDVAKPAPEPPNGRHQEVPVARRAGVDDDQLAGVLDDVPVDDALGQPVDTCCDLHPWFLQRAEMQAV